MRCSPNELLSETYILISFISFPRVGNGLRRNFQKKAAIMGQIVVSEKRSIDASAKNVIYNGNEIENGRGHVMCAPYWTNARLF